MSPQGPILSALVNSEQDTEYIVDYYSDTDCNDYLGYVSGTGTTCLLPPITWQSMYINYN
jgi:hypothetical protein